MTTLIITVTQHRVLMGPVTALTRRMDGSTEGAHVKKIPNVVSVVVLMWALSAETIDVKTFPHHLKNTKATRVVVGNLEALDVILMTL